LGLITIRKGELVRNPESGAVQPASVELVKITGKNRDWCCIYYDDQLGCTRYDDRPLACRTLQCWNTSASIRLFEQKTIARRDIIAPDDKLRPVIGAYDRSFPCDELAWLHANLAQLPEAMREKWQKLVNDDVAFRSRIVVGHRLKLAAELFYFGRPLFQLLQAIGVRVQESSASLLLHWPKESA
jgi:Fe-S-cluster containining protein